MINYGRALETVLVAATLASCGGQSGGQQLDPAASDFCRQFSNALCHMAYVCYFEEARDAAFEAQYGVDIAACQDTWYKRCMGRLPAGTSGPSCGRGKTVNEAAATACADRFVNNLMCAEWRQNPTQGCEAACGDTPHNDAGAADGAAPGTDAGRSDTRQPGPDAGGGVDAGAATPTSVVEYCKAAWNVSCQKEIECGDAQTSLEDCQSLASLMCSGASCSGAYNPSQAVACISAMSAMSCTDYKSDPMPVPPSCPLACPDGDQ